MPGCIAVPIERCECSVDFRHQLVGVAVVDCDPNLGPEIRLRRRLCGRRPARLSVLTDLTQLRRHIVRRRTSDDQRSAERVLRVHVRSIFGVGTDEAVGHLAVVRTNAPRDVLLEDDVEVRSPETEGRHASLADLSRRGLPFLQLRVHEQRRVLEVDVRIRALCVETRREHLVVQRHDRFQHASRTRCRLQMPDVRLHRSKWEGSPGHAEAGEHFTQALDLHDVADARRSTVTLHEAR